VTLLRSGNSPAALLELQGYLESEYLEDWHRAAAHYRLGQALYRQDRYDEAWQAYKEADRIDNHKGARAAMDRMRKRKRDGAIDFSTR
jgi:TolA-binding protein